MKKNSIRLTLLTLLAPCILFAAAASARTYYVDSAEGDDKHSARRPRSAWASLDKVNATAFKPGDRILFRAGGAWQPQMMSLPMTAKYDNVAIADLDGDGDLDVVTTEENAGPDSRGLGVVWYENGLR